MKYFFHALLLVIGGLLSIFAQNVSAGADVDPKAVPRKLSESKFLGTETVNANSPHSLPHDVALADFRAYVKERLGLVLDARPEIFYRFGHVPGALSLPKDEFEKGYAKLKTTLESDMSQPIIVYCTDESCEDSEWVYQALTNLGYSQVSIFRGGWDAWTKAGYPEEK